MGDESDEAADTPACAVVRGGRADAPDDDVDSPDPDRGLPPGLDREDDIERARSNTELPELRVVPAPAPEPSGRGGRSAVRVRRPRGVWLATVGLPSH